MFRGSIVALITPFNEDGGIDFQSLEELIKWHCEEGTEGLVLCGSTGEGGLLSREEKLAIFQKAAEVAKGKIPLIAYTGTEKTQESVFLTQEAKRLGMDACLVILPYCVRPTEEGCYLHFKELACANIPLIFYYHPGRAGLTLSYGAIARICSIPQVVGLKDCSGDFSLLTPLIADLKISVYCGNDDQALPFFSIGAKGAIAVTGNVIPSQWRSFVDLSLQGKLHEARVEYFHLYPLIKGLLSETNPQCVKYGVSILGKCASRMRLPLLEPRLENRQRVQVELERFQRLTV